MKTVQCSVHVPRYTKAGVFICSTCETVPLPSNPWLHPCTVGGATEFQRQCELGAVGQQLTAVYGRMNTEFWVWSWNKKEMTDDELAEATWGECEGEYITAGWWRRNIKELDCRQTVRQTVISAITITSVMETKWWIILTVHYKLWAQSWWQSEHGWHLYCKSIEKVQLVHICNSSENGTDSMLISLTQ